MKTNLPKHIPKRRLNELNLVLESIKEEAQKRHIEIDKIILFGSYARGDFVVKDIRDKEVFMSDFDILVITKKDLGDDTSINFRMYIIDSIRKKGLIEPPFTLIVEDLNHVNHMLISGRYFYADIKMEGVVLYDGSGIELEQYKRLTEKEKLEMIKEDYDIWFPKGKKSIRMHTLALNENFLNECAFNLHQATERFMTSYLLVKTLYKGKTHDLLQLLTNMQVKDKSFDNWFDFKNYEEFRHFELLREAYIGARYDKNYKITKKELEFLEKKVVILSDLIEKLCKKEIEKVESNKHN